MERLIERSVPSLSSTPSAALRPVPPEYTQKPTLPLARVRLVLADGLPPPDSRRTAQDAEVLALSTSLTCSEQLPLRRIEQLRSAVEAVEMPVVLPEYAGEVLKWPTLPSNESRMRVVPVPPPPGLSRVW